MITELITFLDEKESKYNSKFNILKIEDLLNNVDNINFLYILLKYFLEDKDYYEKIALIFNFHKIKSPSSGNIFVLERFYFMF